MPQVFLQWLHQQLEQLQDLRSLHGGLRPAEATVSKAAHGLIIGQGTICARNNRIKKTVAVISFLCSLIVINGCGQMFFFFFSYERRDCLHNVSHFVCVDNME